MRNDVLILILIIFLERKLVKNNVVIMRKKEYFDIFDMRNYRKNNPIDKDIDKIPLELYDEGGNFNKNFLKTDIICTRKNCKIPYGECISNKICQCLEGYASIDENPSSISDKDNNFNGNKIYCNYRQKNQLIAFLLEFIFLFGLGNFYLNRCNQAIIKMILFIFLLIMICLIRKYEIRSRFFLEENISNKRNLVINLLMVFSSCAFLFYHIFDIYMLATNSYFDGYGVEILSWNRDLNKIISFDFYKRKFSK